MTAKPALRFVPYREVGERPNIVVDGAPLPSTVLTLSHWPVNATPVPFKLCCGYDVAIGSRLMQASMVARRLKREVLSRGFNLLIRMLFRTRFSDAQCGFKALRCEVAQTLLPYVVNNGWFFDAELLILAEKNGFRLFEAPIEWMEDLDSRVHLWSTAMEDIKGLVRMRTSRLKLNLPRRESTPAMSTTRGQAGNPKGAAE